jgi:long-chain fatty acid transport protein
MRERRLRGALVVLSVISLAVLPAAPVLASGFQLVEQNGSGLGNAYAGQAAGVKDASAVFFNPAALTRLEGKHVSLAVNGIGISTKFADQGSTAPYLGPLTLPVGESGDGGDAGGWTPVPSAYFSWQASERFWVGLGVDVPFGLKTEWDDDFVGRFHALKSDVKTVNINPTVAVKLSDAFSLGFGASYQRLEATLSQALPMGGLAVASAAALAGPAAAAGIRAQLASQSLDGLVSIEGDNWAWGFNAGAFVTLETVHLGASYRSKVKHDLEGDAAFTGVPAFSESGPLGRVGAGLNMAFAEAFADGPVTTAIDLPDTFSVAASYEGEKLELLADWTWTGWSSIQDLTIDLADGEELSSVPLNFEDTWRAGLGANVKLNEDWTLRLGTAYDKAPVQDEFRTPRLPDQNRVWAAGGFEWKITEKSALDLGYAHLFIEEASSDLANQSDPEALPEGDLVGSYSASVNIVSLQYRISF